jgi:hypothetical protein
MTVEQLISNLQESFINREVVLITDGNNCYIAEYDANLNVIYL